MFKSNKSFKMLGNIGWNILILMRSDKTAYRRGTFKLYHERIEDEGI